MDRPCIPSDVERPYDVAGKLRDPKPGSLGVNPGSCVTLDTKSTS